MQTYYVRDTDYWAYIVAEDEEAACATYRQQVASDTGGLVVSLVSEARLEDLVDGPDGKPCTVRHLVESGPTDEPYAAIVCGDLL